MIERIKAAYRAFCNPFTAVEKPQEIVIDAPCPKCGKQGDEIVQQHVTPLSKTHYCKPCQTFFRPQVQ